VNVVDTSALVEYYLDTPLADTFAPPIEDRARLLVPSIVIFELYKVLLRQAGVDMADEAVMALRECRVVDLDATHALTAAQLGPRHGLAIADSIIYATARLADATLWTQDKHFDGLPGVRCFPKSAA
jgi:predicted nucleic acid-binding protein